MSGHALLDLSGYEELLENKLVDYELQKIEITLAEPVK